MICNDCKFPQIFLSFEGESVVGVNRDGFFDMIEVMKEIGNTEDVRFIYWFDN